MAFDAAQKNGRFGRMQCQRSKESSSRGKRLFLYGRTVSVKVKSKVIPASFLKIEGLRTLVGVKDQREGQIEELVGDQNPGPEAPPMSKIGEERREQKRCQEGGRLPEEQWRRVDMSGSLRGGDQKR